MNTNSKERFLASVNLPGGVSCSVQTNQFRYHVWQILESENAKRGRVVIVAEVKRAYADLYQVTDEELEKLRDRVLQALNFFVLHKMVFTKKEYGKRVYGSLGIIDPKNDLICTLDKTPDRYKILALVHEAVKCFGNRAVRCRDVIDQAAASKIKGFTKRQIVYNIWSLVRTEHLKVVGRTLGDGFGPTLFLPAELSANDIHTPEILSFADLVLHTFSQLWEENKEKAELNNRRIRPIATAEIQDRLRLSGKANQFSRKSSQITSTLNSQSKKAKPSIRVVSQANGLKVWIPIGFDDEEIDLENTYSSNALKIVTAIERACISAGERPVTLTEIKKAVANDPNLALTNSKMSLSRHLIMLTHRKSLNPFKDVESSETIRAIGSIDNRTYYASSKLNAEKSSNFVEFYQLKSDWKKMQKVESWQLIENSRLKSVRNGRIRILLQNAESFLQKLLAIKPEYFPGEYDLLRDEISSVKEQALLLLNKAHDLNLPDKVIQEPKGLPATEATQFLAPFYPVASRLHENKSKSSAAISSSIRKYFRQIPNPDYKQCASHDPRSATLLFEFSDLLIQTALRWGGSECRYQASIAKQELGTLRDVRFIKGNLDSSDFEVRQVALACLAFLHEEVNVLGELAIGDPVAEIRQSALWAYAFSNGEKYLDLARQISERDSDASVREFAQRIAAANSRIDIWRI